MIVLYGRDRLAVSRAALVLLYAGVREVRVFWGGIEAWSRAGYPLETGTNLPMPVAAFGRKIPAHPEYIVDMEQVRALLADQDGSPGLRPLPGKNLLARSAGMTISSPRAHPGVGMGGASGRRSLPRPAIVNPRTWTAQLVPGNRGQLARTGAYSA